MSFHTGLPQRYAGAALRRQLLWRGWGLMLTWCACGGALAAEPDPKMLLTVAGPSAQGGRTIETGFDMAALQALPQHGLETSTPWAARAAKFEGPLLRDVLAKAGVRGEKLKATALNDYAVTIPWSDAMQFPVMIALRMNGQPIPARTKGPLFLIYPFSQYPELDVPKYHRRAIWQLKRLDVS